MGDLRDLLRRLDIVDVIGSYLQLKRVGSNYAARCPFHPDDTPSLYVSPSKGIWKCFGCGFGGDAVKFVSMIENITYGEAILKLAKKYNIPINLERRKKDDKIFQALEEVANFYHESLKEHPKAIDYLKSRGVSSAYIKKFMLGFSPSSEKLVDFLKSKGILEVYEKTGNLIKISKDVYRDRFLNRIIIPIRDYRGRVIGFGGRSMDGSNPKYINSPESEVFKKGETLYGLYEAKDHIRENGYAIVVEGYFDVISMHSAMIKNVVAPLGTALTKEHTLELSKHTKTVVLMLDGDDAGRRAANSAIPNLLSAGLKVKVAFLPEGKDPDSLVRENRDLMIDILENAKDVIESSIESVEKVNSQEFEEVMRLVSYIPSKIERESILQQLSRKLNVPVSTLREQAPKERRELPKAVQDVDKLSYAEKILLKIAMDLGPDVIPVEKLNLSPYAMYLLDCIKEGDLFALPTQIKEMEIEDPEMFMDWAIKALQIDRFIPEHKISRLRKTKTY